MIVVVPGETPEASPDEDPIVATVVLLLLQVPPPVASLKVVVPPLQKLDAPTIAAGTGFTVTDTEVLQPVPGNV